MARDLIDIAHHEAAHIVVGVALGLRLRRVVVGALHVTQGKLAQGSATFDGRCGSIEAWALMYAAGSAWEKRVHKSDAFAWGDESCLRQHGIKSKASVRAVEHAAWCVLMRAVDTHARVTKALLEQTEHTRESLGKIVWFPP